MDINLARILLTLLVMVAFFLIVWIACNRHSKQRYQNIAQYIIDDDDNAPCASERKESNS